MRILTLVATLAALLYSTSAFAAFPGANGRLAYNCGQLRVSICTSNPDGTGETVVFTLDANVNGSIANPRWSPDGTKITFYSYSYPPPHFIPNTSIYVMNADGSNPQLLKQSIPWEFFEDARFSPDGTKIFYHRRCQEFPCNPEPRDVAMNVDGSNPQPLFSIDPPFGGLEFSPDGQKIAAVSGCDIYVLDSDGSNPVNITNNLTTHMTPETDTSDLIDFSECSSSPDWYPSGHSELVYLNQHSFYSATENTPTSIKIVGSDGSYEYTVIPISDEGLFDAPAWSPDGTKITYTKRDINGNNGGIYVMNSDGSNSTRINSDLTQFRLNPDWQPIPGYTPPTSSPSYTASGMDVSVRPVDSTHSTRPVTLTFPAVIQSGDTTVDSITSGPTPPSGFRPGIYYNVSTTATFSGRLTACFSWNQGQFYLKNDVKLFELVDGAWVDVTTSVDATANQVCGETWDLSLFGLFEPEVAFQNGKIAFVRSDPATGQSTGISLMNADGSGEIELTNDADHFPRFSGDGSKLYFLRREPQNSGPSIYTINTDGSNPPPKLSRKCGYYGCSYGDLSADGNQIVVLLRDRYLDPSPELWTMNLDGSNGLLLPIPPCPSSGLQSWNIEQPKWSPDGRKIAFDAGCVYSNGPYTNVFTMNADGSNVTQVTNNSVNSINSDYYVDWSSDGSKLVFSRSDSATFSNFSIVTSHADGSSPVTVLGPIAQFYTDPVWSPDGKIILFDGGRFDWGQPWTSMASGVIYAMNADGGNLVSIGDTSKLRSQPVWQPIPVRAPQFTDTGNYVAVQPIDSSTGTAPATITFDSVSQAGATTVTSSSTGPSTPSGFKAGEPAIYYDISSTSTHTGTITLCFTWTEGQFQNESNVALFHYENSAWTNVTTSLNTTSNKVCGQTTSLSPFALFERHYNFAGFFQPVDNPPTRNSAKAGAAIPVKFSLGGNMGMAILNSGYPASQSVTCNTSAPISEIEQTVTAGGSSLSYDASSGQYIYVWKTDKTWANSCRRLILNFKDGTIKTADFSFTK